MDSPPALPPAKFKDRKPGLVVFGVLTILIGAICALFVPFVLLGQKMAPTDASGQSAPAIIPVLVLYGLLATILVCLGIGSVMARRWARALLLIFSWSWLIVGVASVAIMAVMLPQITSAVRTAAPAGQPPLPESAIAVIMTIIFSVFGVIFVVLPGLWVFFYGSKHVKATCEANDPVERWTDRCPLPVIAVSVWLAFSVPTILIMAVAYRGVFPFFGNFVSGPVGSAFHFLFAIVWGYSAWALYKLDHRGWWAVVIFLILFAISAFITYSRHDVSELYTLMGYPQAQIDLIQKYKFLNGQTVAWFTLGTMIPVLGYLLYIKRYFSRRD